MITTINEYKLYLESKSNRLDVLKQHLDRDNISLAQWIIDHRLVKFNGKLTEKEAIKIIKSVDYHSFYDKLPTMYFFDSPAQDVPDGKWLIHFSIHPKGINRYGFNRGQPDYLKLGMTHGSKLQTPRPGYNFAFDPKDAKVKYGSLQEAFWTWSTYGGGVAFFKAPAIKAYHFGDDVDQVIFWGSDAHDIIVAYINEDSTWKMNGKTFKTLDETYKYLLTLKESVDTERIWKGEEVNQHIKDITPHVHDVPDYYMDKIIKHRNFKIQQVDLENLLKTDPSFKEYYDSGEDRYEDADENDDYMPYPDEINNEIVVVDGELLDGYNRVSSLLRMGEKTTNGFVAI